MSILLAPAAPDPAVPATQLTSAVGDQVLDLAQGIAPVLVPFILATLAIVWVLRKFGVGGVVAWNRALGDTGAINPYAKPGKWHSDGEIAGRYDEDSGDLEVRTKAGGRFRVPFGTHYGPLSKSDVPRIRGNMAANSEIDDYLGVQRGRR